MTSRAYTDFRAVEILDQDFEQGGLGVVSYARPSKLFTAHENILISSAGMLRAESLGKITQAVVSLFQANL